MVYGVQQVCNIVNSKEVSCRFLAAKERGELLVLPCNEGATAPPPPPPRSERFGDKCWG